MEFVTYLLLVTWFSMTGASSYQVEFSSRERCEQAANVLLQEAEKMKQGSMQSLLGGSMPDISALFDSEGVQEMQDSMQSMQGMTQMMAPMMLGMMQPSVSAVCIER